MILQISDPDVETSVSHFLKLIETLLEKPAQREHYFQVSHLSSSTAPPCSALDTLFRLGVDRLFAWPIIGAVIKHFYG